MDQAGFSQRDFKERLEELFIYADIGYHGHFWRNNDDFDNLNNQIKEASYTQHDDVLIGQQFKQDYVWLSDQHFTLPYYAAGWWFMNTPVLNQLIEHKIAADFSYTKLRWVSNPYCKTFFRNHQVRYGEPFRIASNGSIVTCLQTLMGCPNSPFPEDIIRQLNMYLEDYKSPMGMLVTHDYNLIEGNNLKYNKQMITYLQHLKNVSMHSARELVERGSRAPIKRFE